MMDGKKTKAIILRNMMEDGEEGEEWMMMII